MGAVSTVFSLKSRFGSTVSVAVCPASGAGVSDGASVGSGVAVTSGVTVGLVSAVSFLGRSASALLVFTSSSGSSVDSERLSFTSYCCALACSSFA